MEENIVNIENKINRDSNKGEKLNNIPIFSKKLASKLIDLGYFDSLVNMSDNRTKPGQKVYYFSRSAELEKVVDEYKIDRQIVKDALIDMD